MAKAKHGPLTVTMPPVDRRLLDGWLHDAAAEIGNQLPGLAAIAGHVRLQLRASIDTEGRALADIVPTIVSLLAGVDIIGANKVAARKAEPSHRRKDSAAAPDHCGHKAESARGTASAVGRSTRRRAGRMNRHLDEIKELNAKCVTNSRGRSR